MLFLILCLHPAAAALEGQIRKMTVETKAIPHPVEIAVYTPPGFDPKRADRYPLIIQLHGGNGSSDNLTQMAAILEAAVSEGLLPPSISVMPSAGRSFYMDYRDGSQKWESFIIGDLLAFMRERYPVSPGRAGTFITGVSMGGMGALRIAFKHPELFAGVAGMEPGIEPALAYADIKLRDRFWRDQSLFEEKYGKPVDEAYWADNNPATIAKRDPDRLKGLGIYIEAGDQDMFFLHHGSEFLHRILFDSGVSHEYRLVRGGEHVGPSVGPRARDAFSFFGRILNPPGWINGQVIAARRSIDAMKQAAGYPVLPVDPERLRTQ
ncbi:MAG: esterase [Alphaproteobacteria bacterium]|nr:esterase [Alphaproteobacteria bacterium]